MITVVVEKVRGTRDNCAVLCVDRRTCFACAPCDGTARSLTSIGRIAVVVEKVRGTCDSCAVLCIDRCTCCACATCDGTARSLTPIRKIIIVVEEVRVTCDSRTVLCLDRRTCCALAMRDPTICATRITEFATRLTRHTLKFTTTTFFTNRFSVLIIVCTRRALFA